MEIDGFLCGFQSIRKLLCHQRAASPKISRASARYKTEGQNDQFGTRKGPRSLVSQGINETTGCKIKMDDNEKTGNYCNWNESEQVYSISGDWTNVDTTIHNDRNCHRNEELQCQWIEMKKRQKHMIAMGRLSCLEGRTWRKREMNENEQKLLIMSEQNGNKQERTRTSELEQQENHLDKNERTWMNTCIHYQ